MVWYSMVWLGILIMCRWVSIYMKGYLCLVLSIPYLFPSSSLVPYSSLPLFLSLLASLFPSLLSLTVYLPANLPIYLYAPTHLPNLHVSFPFFPACILTLLSGRR